LREVQQKQEYFECKQQRPKATTKQYLKNDVSNGRAGVPTQAVDRVELNPTQILIYFAPFNQSITVAPSHLLIEFSIDNSGPIKHFNSYFNKGNCFRYNSFNNKTKVIINQIIEVYLKTILGMLNTSIVVIIVRVHLKILSHRILRQKMKINKIIFNVPKKKGKLKWN
jgi:hypothetical protein